MKSLNEIGKEVTLTIRSSSTYFDETSNKEVPYEYKFKAKGLSNISLSKKKY